MGAEEDPVARLMEFAAESTNGYERKVAVFLLHGRKDPRIVPWANDVIRREKDWYAPLTLIELLEIYIGKEADRVLVDLLDWDFRTVERTKNPSTDYRAEHYHKEIVKALEKKSGEMLGLDRPRWRDWLQRQP